MAKILMLPFSHQLGTTHRLIKIAEKLRKKGQEVIFAGQGQYMDLISKEGYKIEPLIEIDHDSYLKNLDKASLDIHSEESIKEFVEQELKLMKEVNPDVVVSEMRLTDSISTKIYGIPKISILNTILTDNYAIPITVPETHWLYNIKTSIPFTAKTLDFSANVIKNYYYHSWIHPYNKVSQYYKLKKWKNLYEITQGDYTILPDLPEFAPMKNKKVNMYQVGPIVHNASSKLPDWINKIDNKKTIIYCSLGSTGLHYKKVYDILFDLYANDNRFQIITNTTKLFDPDRLMKANNFFVARLTPASEMMKKCDLVIIHGGLGTIYHALYAKKPILGIPYQAEQEWNLDRVKMLGIGEKIHRNKLNHEILCNTINSILSNKSTNKYINSVYKLLKKHNGAKESSDIIVNIIKKNAKNHTH